MRWFHVIFQVKVLFIRNLALQVSEENITSIFEEASGGPIDRVKKSKDYAFVHFRLVFHSVEFWGFFCHSDFTWNQFRGFQKGKFCHFNTFWGS